MSLFQLSESLLSQRWSEAVKGRLQSIFFSGANVHSFQQHCEQFAHQQNIQLLPYQFTGRLDNLPFSPFLDICQYLVKRDQVDPETLVKQADVYWHHRELFLSLFGSEGHQREEPPLNHELNYERLELQGSIYRILQTLTKDQPIFIALASCHLATPTVHYLLKYLDEFELKGHMLVAIQFDQGFQLSLEDDLGIWQQFIDYVEEEHICIELPPLDPETEPDLIKWPSPRRAGGDPEGQVKMAEQQASFFGHTESRLWAEELIRRRHSGELKIDDDQEMRINRCIGSAMLVNGEFDTALSYFERVADLAQQSQHPLSLAEAFRQCALCMAGKINLPAAEDYWQQAIRISEEHNDARGLALSHFIKFYSLSRVVKSFPYEDFVDLSSQLRNLNYTNLLSFCLRTVFAYTPLWDEISVDDAMAATDEALTILKLQKNYFGIAQAYHSKGILFSYQREYRNTIRCMTASYKIRLKMNNHEEIIPMQNGLGYFYIQMDKYHRAFTYFNEAYSLVVNTLNFNEICVTLYNFAWLYFLEQEHDTALLLINRILRIFHIRGIDTIPFRNKSDLYGIKGICHFQKGELIQAQKCLENSKELQAPPTHTGEILLGLLEAHLLEAQAQVEPAIQRLIRLRVKTIRYQDNDVHFELITLTTLYHIYFKDQQYERALEVIDAAIEIAHAKQLPVTEQRLTQLKQPSLVLDLPDPLPPLSVDLESIEHMARLDVRSDLLQQRLRETRLINRINAIAFSTVTSEDLASSVTQVMHTHFPCRGCIMATWQSKKWQILAYHGDIQSYDLTLKGIRPSLSCQLYVDRRIFVPVKAGKKILGGLVMPMAENKFNLATHTLDNLEALGNQVGFMLERIEREQLLKHMSQLDTLTGLYNRKALYDHIHAEVERMKRYPNTPGFTVAYIDFDHFKYYNDRFGHGLGDLLLQAFAKLTQKVIRASDYAARIGGDEFVIVFPQTHEKEAENMGNRLIEALRRSHSFQNELDRYFGKPMEVPEAMRLNCSIGIAEFALKEHLQDAVEHILMAADQAMYRAKANGKGQVSN